MEVLQRIAKQLFGSFSMGKFSFGLLRKYSCFHINGINPKIHVTSLVMMLNHFLGKESREFHVSYVVFDVVIIFGWSLDICFLRLYIILAVF